MIAKNTFGFSLIEVLMASVIVSASVLCLSSLLLKLKIATVKSTTLITAVAIEDSLTQALKNETSYSLTNKINMRAGLWPQDVVLSLKSQYFSDISLPALPNAINSVCFDKAATVCSCTSYSENCPLRLDLQIRLTNGQFQYAYQVAVHPNVAVVANLGSKHPDGFHPDDFKFQIPENTYRFSSSQSCRPGDAAINGMIRDTGEVLCLEKPNLDDYEHSCRPGTFPKSLEVIKGIVSFRCSEQTQTVYCPDPNFVLQTLNPASLESGEKKSATCRMVTEETSVYKTQIFGDATDAGSISGEVCPESYVSKSICTVKEIESIAGSCPTSVAGDPVPEPPKKNFTPNFTESGRNVTNCQVIIPGQRCGAIWKAKVVLQVRCVLNPTMSAARDAQ